MKTRPFAFDLDPITFVPESYDRHTRRTLSQMAGQYLDGEAFDGMLEQADQVLYEVYEMRRPEIAGELLHGTSILHPGRVGDEYFMTKGHFHAVRATAEVYFCLKGRGFLVMENSDGASDVAELVPGRVVYVLPGWAHRSVNVSDEEDLVTFFVYPGHSGHDYGTIEKQGFRKRVLARAGKAVIIDNPRWPAEQED